MIFRIYVSPHKIIAPTKSQLESKLREMGMTWQCGTNGSGWVKTNFRASTQDAIYYGVNFEKHRKKRKFNGAAVISTPPHWIAFIYKIPQGFKREQLSRNFKVSLK